MVERSHTISTAAAEIVALINSRSQSPWPHEIEAIIAKAKAPADRSPSTRIGAQGHQSRGGPIAEVSAYD